MWNGGEFVLILLGFISLFVLVCGLCVSSGVAVLVFIFLFSMVFDFPFRAVHSASCFLHFPF